jgi:asparagine N-glycosylation enzyme membrane subunit Stt3
VGIAMTFSLNHVVAVLGGVLSIAVYLLMRRYSVPEKLCVGAAILAALVVSIFWTSVMLGTGDDDE